MKITPFILLCLFVFNGVSLEAVELKLDREHLTESGQYKDDYLFTGNSLNFDGEARDVFGFAEYLNFSGKATLAIMAAGRQIDLNGTIGNGIKAAGRDINIKSNTTGTNFLAAEQITFEQESQTRGDTFIGARRVVFKGPLTGNLYVGAGEVSLQNEIKGNVNVHAGQLKISDQGKIIGNLIYHSDHELSEEETARITGDITFKKTKEGGFHDTFADRDFNGSLWFSLLFKLAFAVLGFLVLLFPVARVLEIQRTQKEVLSHALWGLIPVFVYPSAFVISIVLLITIPLAVAMFLGFIPLLFITKIIGITLIGGLITNMMNMSAKNRFLSFLIGVILYSLLSLIPYFGFLLMVFVSSIGCGLLLSSLFQKKFA